MDSVLETLISSVVESLANEKEDIILQESCSCGSNDVRYIFGVTVFEKVNNKRNRLYNADAKTCRKCGTLLRVTGIAEAFEDRNDEDSLNVWWDTLKERMPEENQVHLNGVGMEI